MTELLLSSFLICWLVFSILFFCNRHLRWLSHLLYVVMQKMSLTVMRHQICTIYRTNTSCFFCIFIKKSYLKEKTFINTQINLQYIYSFVSYNISRAIWINLLYLLQISWHITHWQDHNSSIQMTVLFIYVCACRRSTSQQCQFQANLLNYHNEFDTDLSSKCCLELF